MVGGAEVVGIKLSTVGRFYEIVLGGVEKFLINIIEYERSNE